MPYFLLFKWSDVGSIFSTILPFTLLRALDLGNVAKGDDFWIVQDVLALLRTLYALIVLEEDVSFLRYGYLTVENAAVVRQEVIRLCSELRPHALALVSSFGIPDAFLSPIAFDWIDANSWSSVQHWLNYLKLQFHGFWFSGSNICLENVSCQLLVLSTRSLPPWNYTSRWTINVQEIVPM